MMEEHRGSELMELDIRHGEITGRVILDDKSNALIESISVRNHSSFRVISHHRQNRSTVRRCH
jgi:hypothetical protein